MEQEYSLLLWTAISLGFLHTVSGPDHYLPFLALAKSGNWSLKKTAWVTGICGIAHIGGALLIGLGVLHLFPDHPLLDKLSSSRGSFIAWLFISFGLIFIIRGIKELWKRKQKRLNGKYQVLGASSKAILRKPNNHLTFWILFIIFLFGPCEPLIPVLLFPAATIHPSAMIAVVGVFALTTVASMLLLVLIPLSGLKRIRIRWPEQYRHIISGVVIMLCGIGIQFLGL